jgi:hypothetical protein
MTESLFRVISPVELFRKQSSFFNPQDYIERIEQHPPISNQLSQLRVAIAREQLDRIRRHISIPQT